MADLVVTDPPYNVGIENSQGMTIINDNMNDNAFSNFLTKAFKCMNDALKPGGAFTYGLHPGNILILNQH